MQCKAVNGLWQPGPRSHQYILTFSSQFQQHFMSSFRANILLLKKLQNQTVIREKLQKELSYKKVLHKMMMKLTTKEYLTYATMVFG